MSNLMIIPCKRCGKPVKCDFNKCSGEHECWYPIGCNKTPHPSEKMWDNIK